MIISGLQGMRAAHIVGCVSEMLMCAVQEPMVVC